MTHTKQVTVKKVTLTRGTEGEWFSGGVCAGSGQVASWGFLQLVTESDTAWGEKEGGGERLMSGPQAALPSQSLVCPYLSPSQLLFMQHPEKQLHLATLKGQRPGL